MHPVVAGQSVANGICSALERELVAKGRKTLTENQEKGVLLRRKANLTGQ
jgi:hypothetical protein